MKRFYAVFLVYLVCSQALLVASFDGSDLVKRQPDDDTDWDGLAWTIGTVVADWLLEISGLSLFTPLVNGIIDVLHETFDPSDDPTDYWSLLEDEVSKMVGSYINQHNIDEVMIYKDDLGDLLDRYNKAPNFSITYPDKNVMADSLSTSIITNRYLVEAAIYPQSMILHFTDVASIHLMVLKNVASLYSPSEGPPSRWWKDLSHELDHYIDYTDKQIPEFVQWRLSTIGCDYEEASSWCLAFDWLGFDCYDTYTYTDGVTDASVDCSYVHGEDDCDSFCDDYVASVNQTVIGWLNHYVIKPLDSWKSLNEEAAQKAAHASKFAIPGLSSVGNHGN